MKIPQSIVVVNGKPAASKAITKLKLKQNELTKKTIHALEASIADPATSFIDKTRARLDLAILQGEGNSNEQSRILKEIGAIKGVAGVAKTKDKLEQDILSNQEVRRREKMIRSHQEHLTKEALQRRVDAKRRAEEQRKKAKDAEELLSQLEKEAEEAVAKAKGAMKRVYAARVEAGKEQTRALELEAQNDELQLKEEGSNPTNNDDEEVDAVKTTSLIKIAPSPRDSRAASIQRRQRSQKEHVISQKQPMAIFKPTHIQREVNRVETQLDEFPRFSPEWFATKEELVELNIKLGESQPVIKDVSLMEEKRKDEQDRLNLSVNLSDHHLKDETTLQRSSSAVEGYATKYFQLSIKLEEIQKERDELDSRLKERETSIESLRGKNIHHEEKIMSLNRYIKEAGQTQEFWKYQSKCLAEKVEMARRTKSEQEDEMMIIKDQLDIKLKEIDDLKAEIDDLRQTKEELEAELSTVEETQRCVLLELKGVTDALLEEKEHALNTLQIVQDSNVKVLADHEDQINALTCDISAYKKDLEHVNNDVLDLLQERVATESDTMHDDEVKQLSEECRRWKKKATSLNFKLDVLKDESKAQKKEISRLIKSDQDKLYSDYKLLKKKAKDMQFKLGVIKKELKERDAIIDELTQQVVSSEAASHVEGPYAGQKGADYWKDEATKLQEKLTKLERHSRVRDAMMEISNEVSELNKRQAAQELGTSLDSTLSLDVEEINMADSHSYEVLDKPMDTNKSANCDDVNMAMMMMVATSSIKEIDEKVKADYQFSPKGYEGRIVFLLSCKICNKDLHYIGTAHRDVISKIDDHFGEVWNELQKSRARWSEEENVGIGNQGDEGTPDDFFRTSTFTQHLLQHCRHIHSQDELSLFLRTNVRIEVLNKGDNMLHVKRLRLTKRPGF